MSDIFFSTYDLVFTMSHDGSDVCKKPFLILRYSRLGINYFSLLHGMIRFFPMCALVFGNMTDADFLRQVLSVQYAYVMRYKAISP